MYRSTLSVPWVTHASQEMKKLNLLLVVLSKRFIFTLFISCLFHFKALFAVQEIFICFSLSVDS